MWKSSYVGVYQLLNTTHVAVCTVHFVEYYCIIQQMHTIYKYRNIRECSKKQICLIYILHFLDKSNVNKFILQQCTVSNHMYWDAHLPAKICEAPICVRSTV